MCVCGGGGGGGWGGGGGGGGGVETLKKREPSRTQEQTMVEKLANCRHGTKLSSENKEEKKKAKEREVESRDLK